MGLCGEERAKQVRARANGTHDPQRAPASAHSRFDHRGVFVCEMCGKRTRRTNDDGVSMLCAPCYAEAENENARL